MEPICFELALMRGSDYSRIWSLTDLASGASLVNVGDAIELVIKAAAGVSTSYLTLVGAADTTTSGISGVDPATGEFAVTVRGSDLSADIPGSVQDVVKCSWKLQVTSGGLTTVYAYGLSTIYPEA